MYPKWVRVQDAEKEYLLLQSSKCFEGRQNFLSPPNQYLQITLVFETLGIGISLLDLVFGTGRQTLTILNWAIFPSMEISEGWYSILQILTPFDSCKSKKDKNKFKSL